MFQRASAWKLGLFVLSGCCVVVATVAGVSSTVTARAAGNTIPVVDHQLCYFTYTPTSAKFNVPPVGGVKLVDQFNPNGFTPAPLFSKAEWHCNPVRKTVQTRSGPKVYKVTNPAAHLACLPVVAATQGSREVQVQNQFGKAVLFTGQPRDLCVPSWTGLSGAPNKTPNTPPNLNHFTCYSVTVHQGAYQPPLVLLTDAFTSTTTRNSYVPVNPQPDFLCVAAKKIVGKKVYPIINASTQLLCFPVPKRHRPTAVWDENQFGTAKVTLAGEILVDLCVPSTMQIIPR
jgi:hypothetical protein